MLTGYVDSVKGGVANGWAWDPDEPSKHVKVEVSADTGHSHVVTANKFRGDLRDAGKGNGDHGFSFKLPAEWQTQVPTTLTFRFAETGELLPRGTVAVTPHQPMTVTDDQDLFASANEEVESQDEREVKTGVLVNAAYSVTLKVRNLKSSLSANISVPGQLRVVNASGKIQADKRLEFRDVGREGGLRILQATFKIVRSTTTSGPETAPVETTETAPAETLEPFPSTRETAFITLTLSAKVPDTREAGTDPSVNFEFPRRYSLGLSPFRSRSAKSTKTQQKRTASMKVVRPVLIRQIAPELVTPFETGTASPNDPQASFSMMVPGDGRPETLPPPRAPRIAAIADSRLAAAFARCAYVQHLTPDLENSLWHDRFDLLLLQMSQLQTWLIGHSHAHDHLLRCLDLCTQLQIPVVLYFDAPDDGLLSDTGLAAGVAVALIEQPQLRQSGDLKADHAISIAPLIDTTRYNPFGQRDRRAMDADFGGNGLYAADGWWDLSRAGWDIADSIKPILPRLVVMDSRYDVSVFRVQKEAMLRWNTIGAVDERSKLNVLKQCSFLVLADAGGGPGANMPRAMAEARACGCLPITLDSKASGGKAPDMAAAMGGVRLSELTSLAALKKDLMIYRSTLETLRTSDAKPIMRRITRTLYPNRNFSYQNTNADVSVITVSMRPWNIENILANYRRQAYEDKEHIIIIHGSFSAEEQEPIKAAVSQEARTRVYFCPPQITLGGCLNYGVKRAGGQFVAKFDDDDYYTEDYLSDAMLLIGTAGANMYTQPSGLVYLAQSQSLIRFRPGVNASFAVHDAISYPGFTGAGGTLILAKQLVENIGFSENRRGGIDSDFVARAIVAGESLHVGAYFNYVFFRGGDKAVHTWRKLDDEFMANADMLASGGSLSDCLLELGLTAEINESSAARISAQAR